jgi:iron only hydrogenase large subunit-like protein
VPVMSARTKEGHNRGSMRAMGGFQEEWEYEVKKNGSTKSRIKLYCVVRILKNVSSVTGVKMKPMRRTSWEVCLCNGGCDEKGKAKRKCDKKRWMWRIWEGMMVRREED